jgi:hypothetical protein
MRCHGLDGKYIFEGVLNRTVLLPGHADSGCYRDFKIVNAGTRSGALNMNRAHRFVSALFLTAALAASGSALVAATPQEASVRVYDSHHHDYHNWDDREDHAYRGYLVERHQDYRAYDKQNHREQANYWNWRHSHPD